MAVPQVRVVDKQERSWDDASGDASGLKKRFYKIIRFFETY